MTPFRILREQVLNLVGRVVGSRHEMPTVFEAQVGSVGNVGEIKSLPIVYSAPVQIVDTSDPNFGKFKFMVGYSVVGGPDVLG